MYRTNVTIANSDLVGNSVRKERLRSCATAPMLASMQCSSEMLYADDFEPGSGGAMYLFASAALLSGVTLRGNVADEGGALAASGRSNVTASAATLQGNSAAFAGAAVLRNFSVISSADSSFKSNSASSSGGAFLLSSGASLAIDGCSVADNYARIGGGVAFVEAPGAQVNFTGVEIVNNTAGVWGPTTATDGFTAVLVSFTSSVPTGSELSAALSVTDGYGVTLGGLPESEVTVTCPDNPLLIARPAFNALATAISPIRGVVLAGKPGSNHTLVVTVRSRVFRAPVSVQAVVYITDCGFLEVRADGRPGTAAAR